HRSVVSCVQKEPIAHNRSKAEFLASQHGSPETPKDRNRCYLSPHSAVLHQPASAAFHEIIVLRKISSRALTGVEEKGSTFSLKGRKMLRSLREDGLRAFSRYVARRLR